MIPRAPKHHGLGSTTTEESSFTSLDHRRQLIERHSLKQEDLVHVSFVGCAMAFKHLKPHEVDIASFDLVSEPRDLAACPQFQGDVLPEDEFGTVTGD